MPSADNATDGSSVGAVVNLEAQRRKAGGLRPGSQRREHHGAERGAAARAAPRLAPCGDLLPADSAGAGGAAGFSRTHRSSPVTSPMLCHRRSGSFSRQRRRMWSSIGCAPRSLSFGGGSLLMMAAITVSDVDALEGLAAGEHLVEHAAEREDVGTLDRRRGRRTARAPCTESCPSRRQRRRRWLGRQPSTTSIVAASDASSRRPRRCGPRREPEVEQLDVRRARRTRPAHEHDVARLQIAVHDAGAVRPVERRRRSGRRCRARRRPAAPGNDAAGLPSVSPFEILEDQVVELAVAADVMDGADVRIVQRRNGAGFAARSAGAIPNRPPARRSGP